MPKFSTVPYVPAGSVSKFCDQTTTCAFAEIANALIAPMSDKVKSVFLMDGLDLVWGVWTLLNVEGEFFRSRFLILATHASSNL